jgi:iron(III) transport system permease protein
MALKKQGSKFDLFSRIAITLVAVIIFLFVLLPVGTMVLRSFETNGLTVYKSLFSNPYVRQILLNTIWIGISVGALGTLLGFILAYIQVRVNFRGKKIQHVLNLVPLVSPPFAFATAVIVLFGRSGIITRDLLGLTPTLYGYPGLLLVLTLSYFPIAYMNMLGMLRSLDPAIDEAASSLGAAKGRIFRTVTIPLLIPGIASSFLLLFVETIADLANPLVIGGDYNVLALRAYIAISGEYNLAGGAAYSAILLVPALLVFIIQRYWSQKNSVVSVTGKPSGQIAPITNKIVRTLLLAFGWFVSFFIVLIYATVILGAFVKIIGINNTFTLDNFRYILSGIGNDAIVKTTMMALIAMPIAGFLGMLIAWLVIRKVKRGAEVLDFFGMLGIALPGTVLGIGYAYTFNEPIKVFGVTILPQIAGGGSIFGGAVAIIAVYMVRSSPVGQRSGIAALQQIDTSIDEASASLGASGGRTFRKISLPLIRPAFLTGLMFAFARSMTTLSPIIFITTPNTPIITSLILAEADTARYGYAFAFCLILMTIVLTVMGLINLVVRGQRSSNYQPNVIVGG